MSSPRWSEVQEAWEPDGALRDVYVHASNETDWQRVVDLVRSRDWPSSYSEDGECVPMPPLVKEIFERRQRLAVSWSITPAPEIHINCHFFTAEEIEFDLAPWEIVSQFELDVVADFVRAIGLATEKPVVVCYENMPDAPIMSYDLGSDSVKPSATSNTT